MRFPAFHRGYALLVALAFAPIGAVTARAELRRLTLDDLVRHSELIVCGKVVSLKCYRGRFLGRGELIFTDVTVEITEEIAGKSPKKTVTIQVPGGRIGEQFLVCPEAPTYRKGERVLLFLRRYNGCCWNTGWSHGKYTLANDADEDAASVASSSAVGSTGANETEALARSTSAGPSGSATGSLRVRGRPHAPLSRLEDLDAVRRRIQNVRRQLQSGRPER